MRDKKISVIIPVYNVEKYLYESLESVINQTYRNLQIILVDDGSTDNSGIICEEYAAKDLRISVIHQKNAGAGAAKNAGLELINGEFFSIIDSDDYLDRNMYENMMWLLEKYNSDIAECAFQEVYSDKSIGVLFNYQRKKTNIRNRNVFLKEYLFDWKHAVFSNKLFRTSLLQNNRFPVGRKIDDEFFTYKVVCNAKRIVTTNDTYYNYRMRKSSVMRTNDDKELITDRIECFAERYEYIRKNLPTLSGIYYYKLADALVYYDKLFPEYHEFLLQYLRKYPLENMGILERARLKIFYNKFPVEVDDKGIESMECLFE